MKFNKWTLGLAALGVVSLASAARADEAKMSQVQTALSNTTLSGYVDTAATWRPGTDQGPLAAAPNMPGYSFANNDGFSLNAVDLALDKPEDEGLWASGYHLEFMAGPDSVPGSGIRQAYLTLRTPIGNGIDWKVGVFDTVIGYESTSDPLDPNFTRSYGYTIEPTTHTGVLATYKFNDVLTVAGGVADTSNVGGGAFTFGSPTSGTVYESQKTYMATIALTAPDSFGALKGATLNLGVINGVDSAAGAGTRTDWYVGATVPTPNSNISFGAAFDYLNYNNNAGGSDDSVWVAGLYSTIKASDKLSFNFRGEIVDATQLGATSANPFAIGNSAAAAAAYAGHYAGELTATATYQLWANVLSRVEFRWDHVDGNAFGYAAGTGLPNRDNDFMLALNLIYQF